MKILRIILVAILIVVAIVLITAIFLPSQYHIERQTIINAPVDTVFALVSDYHHWLEWNPWSQMDSQAEHTIRGEGIGSSWQWNGDKIGRGKLTLEKIKENQFIQSELVFLSPNEMHADDFWYFKSQDQRTLTIWAQEGRLSYPLGRIMGLFLDGMIGPDFERGLNNLRQLAEQKHQKI